MQPPAEKLLATSVFEIIRAEGFEGSYQTVVRHMRERRGPRFRAGPAVSVPIETAPAEECQFDFSDCSDWTERWGLGEVWCFGCILCWSRWRLWWFTDSVDREHTFEGLVRFFEAAGGVPKVGRTDRMGALGVSQGKRFRLHPPAIGFARHHSMEIKACQAGDAKRKGKCERPFRDLKESFLTELDALGAPGSIGELNQRAGLWLPERVHSRPHSTTGVAPAERLEIERRFLRPCPPAVRHRLCRQPPGPSPPAAGGVGRRGLLGAARWVGHVVCCRVEVDSDTLEITAGTTLVCPASPPARRDRGGVGSRPSGRGRGHRPGPVPARRCTSSSRPHPTVTGTPGRLDLGAGDYDVESLDLQARYGGCGCTGRGA